MSDSDSSIDSDLYISLRNRKVLKNKTHPDLRSKVATGRPVQRAAQNSLAQTMAECADRSELGELFKQTDDLADYAPPSPEDVLDDSDSASLLQVTEKLSKLQLPPYEERPLTFTQQTSGGMSTANLTASAPPMSEASTQLGAIPKTRQPEGQPRQITFQREEPSLSRPRHTAEIGSLTETRRARSSSHERDHSVRTVTVPADMFYNTVSPAPSRAISDTVVAPKPFTGRSSQDPEAWLEYFERYANFRKLTPADRLDLFGMMMHEGAADWLATLPLADTSNYHRLTAAFTSNYCRSPELKWKEAGDLFNQKQGPDERVEDFVTRMRKAARRLNLTPDTLHYALINGLKNSLRFSVVQSGLTTLENSIRIAKIAEAAAVTNTDTVSRLVLDAMKNSALAAERQAAEIKSLTSQVAALAMAKMDTDRLVAPVERPPGLRTPSGRQLLPTPQNQQRLNYAANRSSAGPRSFTTSQRPEHQPTQQPSTSGPPCGRCGLHHTVGKCRADGQQCRQCGRMNHFARVCRSGRPRQN